MKKNLLLAVLILFAGTKANSAGNDSGIITGIVYDSQSLAPLPSATIVYGRGMGIVSDNDGYYSIRSGPGELILTYRYMGYRPVTLTVSITAGDTVVLDVGLQPEAAEIDQVVVSAGKAEQRLSELTVSMSIIKPETISSLHITDPVELINKTPGIEVVDGQASIRGGSGFSYGAGSRVMALIDGLPILAADAGHIKWQFLPLENISQIEIIKGATSVLYGSSALNGVINFRTSLAEDKPVTRFYIETGVFDRPDQREWIWWDTPRTFQSGSLSHIRKSGNTGMSMALHLLSDDGYRRLNEERLGRVNFKISHDGSGGLSYGTNLNAGITRTTNFILWENAWTGALRQDESTANRLHGNLFTFDPYIIYNPDGPTGHELRTRLQSADNFYPTATRNNSNTFSFLAEYLFKYDISSLVRINSGIMENYSRINSEFHGDHRSLNLAGFIQTDLMPVEGLKIVAGVRMEHNSLNGVSDRLVPLVRTGVNYRLLDYTFLRASFGQGYRYPSIAEKHAATTMGSVRIVPNPGIRSESGWSAEIGVKQGIITGTINGQVDLAVFQSRYTDMIEYLFGIYPTGTGESVSYGFMASNIENSRVYGGELEFVFTGTMRRISFNANGGYVFMYPREFNPATGQSRDEYLKYRRMHSFKANLNGNYKKFSAGISFYAGSRFLNIDNVFLSEFTREIILPGFYDYWNATSGGHILVDPHIGYMIGENIRISCMVKNLFNREYMGRPGDIQPHRNFSIRLSGDF